MIQFKHPKYEREFLSDAVRSDLRALVVAMASWVEGKRGVDIIVTAVLPEPGVERASKSHAEGRAVDIRVTDWPSGFGEDVALWVNSRFSTGVIKPTGDPMQVAVLHDVGFGNHVHLQVPKGRPVIINSPNGPLLI
jgi:hypothetical protein